MDTTKNTGATIVINIPTVGSVKETIKNRVADAKRLRKEIKIARLETQLNELKK